MSLGREHIEQYRHIPGPDRKGLGDMVAGLFGAVLTEDAEQPVAPAYRPNRATRRAAAKQARRRA